MEPSTWLIMSFEWNHLIELLLFLFAFQLFFQPFAVLMMNQLKFFFSTNVHLRKGIRVKFLRNGNIECHLRKPHFYDYLMENLTLAYLEICSSCSCFQTICHWWFGNIFLFSFVGCLFRNYYLLFTLFVVYCSNLFG